MIILSTKKSKKSMNNEALIHSFVSVIFVILEKLFVSVIFDQLVHIQAYNKISIDG